MQWAALESAVQIVAGIMTILVTPFLLVLAYLAWRDRGGSRIRIYIANVPSAPDDGSEPEGDGDGSSRVDTRARATRTRAMEPDRRPSTRRYLDRVAKTLDQRIREVLTDALDATDARGDPDHATRLRAAELLLRSKGRGDQPPAESDEVRIVVHRAG